MDAFFSVLFSLVVIALYMTVGFAVVFVALKIHDRIKASREKHEFYRNLRIYGRR